MTDEVPITAVEARKPSAIDITIRELARNAKYMAVVAAGNGADKESPEFKGFRDGIVATSIGAAIGIGKLYRKSEIAADAPLGDQVKAFERDARWLAAAAGDNLGMDKDTAAYKDFADKVADAALATAVAHGRFKAPNRSFAGRVEDGRANDGGNTLGV